MFPDTFVALLLDQLKGISVIVCVRITFSNTRCGLVEPSLFASFLKLL